MIVIVNLMTISCQIIFKKNFILTITVGHQSFVNG